MRPPAPSSAALRTDLRAQQARDEHTLCRRRKERLLHTFGPSIAPIVEACSCRDMLLSDLDALRQMVAVTDSPPDDMERRLRLRSLAIRMLEYPSKAPPQELERFLREVLRKARCLAAAD